MATAAAGLITFAEFERLPDPVGFRYELHHGELVHVPPPKHEHCLIQRTLRRLLEEAAGAAGVVDKEIPFRATPDHDYRVADVAFIEQSRWDDIPRRGNLLGAPDLSIEVLSPSNTASEIFDKEHLCLENGSREFWVVDPVRRSVKVSTSDGRARTYRTGERIPLFFGGTISLDDIFSQTGA